VSCDPTDRVHSSYACATCDFCDRHCQCRVTAQHEETGRIWAGPKSLLPYRYFIVPQQPLRQPAGKAP